MRPDVQKYVNCMISYFAAGNFEGIQRGGRQVSERNEPWGILNGDSSRMT